MNLRLARLAVGITALCVSVWFCAAEVSAANILFIGRDADPTFGDDPFAVEHLEDLGHTVTYMQSTRARTADGRNVDLIVLSSTPDSGTMRGKFQGLETPILNWEEALIRWTDPNNLRTSEGSTAGSVLTDTFNIVEPNHCLAAGLPAGELVVFDGLVEPANSFGEYSPDLIVIATAIDSEATQDPPEAMISAIEKGGELGPLGQGTVAPGPRLNFGLRDVGFASLNENGLKLFDAAVEWLINDGKCVGGGGGPPLQPGDANMDLQFNQLDLVQVQISAKYLTGQPATWGQGDWNGAPGGSQGNPPAGNGFFDQLDIIAALGAGKYLTGPYAALAPSPGREGDGQTSIVYNPSTGEVRVDAPAGQNLTSINIDSAASIFTGAPAQSLGGSFDNDSDNNIFKATFGSSFGSLSFGNVAQPGLSQQFVVNDLTAVGSLAGGGALGPVDLVYIPEPSTAALLALALFGLLAVARRR
jgi:hypothetical protein